MSKLFVRDHAVPKELNIRRIQTDGAQEFIGEHSAFQQYCVHEGIITQHSPRYDQQSNSVVERMQGSLFAMVRRMLYDARRICIAQRVAFSRLATGGRLMRLAHGSSKPVNG